MTNGSGLFSVTRDLQKNLLCPRIISLRDIFFAWLRASKQQSDCYVVTVFPISQSSRTYNLKLTNSVSSNMRHLNAITFLCSLFIYICVSMFIVWRTFCYLRARKWTTSLCESSFTFYYVRGCIRCFIFLLLNLWLWLWLWMGEHRVMKMEAAAAAEVARLLQFSAIKDVYQQKQ